MLHCQYDLSRISNKYHRYKEGRGEKFCYAIIMSLIYHYNRVLICEVNNECYLRRQLKTILVIL